MSSASTPAVEPQRARASDRCLVCGHRLAAPALTPRSSYAAVGRYQIASCTGCGSGTTWPRPTAAELEACYVTRYGYAAHTLIEREKRFRSRCLLERSRVAAGRILDIGCMFGFLLDEAAARGLETWGVELATAPAAVATERGHHVTVGTLDDHLRAHPDLRFDLIVAQHVLEHVADPRAFCATAAALLAPGGRLVLAVPNFAARLRGPTGAAWGWYQVPVHLHHLTPRGLSLLVCSAGLTVDDEATRGGDSLFLAITALQALRRPAAAAGDANPAGRIARAALAAVGYAVRPYYRYGDDELIVVARKP